ncbi:MAG: hypothetical protein WAX66_01925 [Patescibacteria group bacterium]
MENNKHKSIFPLVIIFLSIGVLVFGAYWYGKQSSLENIRNEIEKQKEAEESKESTSSKEEEKKDEEKGEGEEESEETEEKDTEEEIKTELKKLFAVKYDKEIEDVNVTVSQRKGNYIVGGVKFAGEMAGGYLLGAKVNGEWKIIFDGNGTIPCSSVDEVSFPSDLVTECWDTVNMESVDRTR